jgi:hypothetical protein
VKAPERITLARSLSGRWCSFDDPKDTPLGYPNTWRRCYVRADLYDDLRRQLALVWARSVKPLVWSEPSEAGGGIRFNQVRAESVLGEYIGEYIIEWECGKENAEYVVYHCGLRVAAEPTIEAAKAAAQADYEAHSISALKGPTP